jgi:hypothetical protein
VACNRKYGFVIRHIRCIRSIYSIYAVYTGCQNPEIRSRANPTHACSSLLCDMLCFGRCVVYRPVCGVLMFRQGASLQLFMGTQL